MATKIKGQETSILSKNHMITSDQVLIRYGEKVKGDMQFNATIDCFCLGTFYLQTCIKTTIILFAETSCL